MDLISRYIYAVVRRLPEKQREDIEKELRTLIDDMLEQCDGSETDEVKVQKVLQDLGDPEIMAENYRSKKRYLIGPENFDKYIFILKIVLGAVFIGLSVATAVGGIFDHEPDFVNLFANYFGTLFSGLFQAFAWVTITFAIAEYNGVDIKGTKQKGKAWSLSQLPLIPEKKAAISPWDPIMGILFSAIFMTVLYFEPQLFAAYFSGNGSATAVIPIFNLQVINAYKMLFVIAFVLSVLKEVLKLMSGRWSLKLAIAIAVPSIITTILMVMIFANPTIWNPNFSAEVMKHASISIDFSYIWGKFVSAFILIMVAACILDVSTALYKGAKYNMPK
jgi:hypothetical protein